MNNKSILAIIIAVLLALFCSMILVKKEKSTQNTEIKELKQEKIEAITDAENKVPTEFYKEDKNPLINEKKDFQAVTEKKEFVKNEIKFVEKAQENYIQEASIVEEVPDYGIVKDDNGFIFVTREFKTISPKKFYFKDFGVIEKISK